MMNIIFAVLGLRMDHFQIEILKKLSIILLLAVFCGHLGLAQVSVSANTRKGVYTLKGDYYFDHNNFVTAISNYSKSLNQNPKDLHTMLRIAEANERLGNDDLANQWYSKAFGLHRDIDETYILKYISLLHKIENYETLRHWVTIYNERISRKYQAEVARSVHYDSMLVLIHNLRTINSSGSDLGPAFDNDLLLFSSDRVADDGVKPRLYRAVLNTKGEYEGPTLFPVDVTTLVNAGPIAIAQKSGSLFFTGTGEPQVDEKPLMEVFFSDLPANPSDKIKMDKLVIKSFDHGMGHPAVNSEGTLMFFTSNNPKNDRGFDLYRSEYNGKNWSAPKALGSNINTPGDEMYPALYNDSILYFASNGHGGLGGLDIYKVNIHAKHPKAEHLKTPVNSPSDDFGLVFSNHGGEGYLVSNRPGGLGGDDLYKFHFLPVRTKQSEAIAEDKSKPEELSLYTSNGNEIKLTDHDNQRNLAFEFIPGMSYTLIMDYENHKTGTIKPNSAKTALPKRNAYTFEIQKLSRSVYDQKEKGAMVKDVHINPGDLVTFQLIPNGKATDAESSNSKIHFNKGEAIIKLGDTIVFSYVAEAGPETPATEDTQPVADLNTTKEDVSIDEKVDDTASTKESTLAKNTQSGNIVTDMTTLQNNETVEQDQSATKSKNSAVNTVGENAVNPIQQNTPENTHQVTDHLARPDSLDRKNFVAANNDQAKDASQFPSADAIALQNHETIQPSRSVSIDNNSAVNAIGETEAQQIKTQNVNPPPDGYVPSDSADANNVIAKNDSPEDASRIPVDGIVSENNAQIKQNQTALNDKNADTTAVSPEIAKTFQQNTTEDLNQVPDSYQPSDSLEESIVLTKIIQAKAVPQISTNVPAPVTNESTEHIEPTPENNAATNTANENTVKTPPASATHEYLARSNGENNDFEYRVQIAANKSALSDVQLKKIYRGAKEIQFFQEDEYYKYIIEVTPSYPEAQQALQKSGVDHAFISAYKGDTKWNLKEAIALQNKDRMAQTLADREDKNADHSTMTSESMQTALQDNKLNSGNPVAGNAKISKLILETDDSKTDPDQPLAIHSLTGSDKNTDEENISNTMLQKDPVSTVNPGDLTSVTKDIRLSGSPDAGTPEKNNQPDSVSEFSPDAIALQTKETSIEQRPLVFNVEDDATDKNRIETGHQNKPEDGNQVPGDYQLSASLDRNYVFTDKERQSDSSQFSSDRAMPVNNKAAIEQNQSDRENKNNDLRALTGSVPDPGSSFLSTAHPNQTPDNKDNNKFEYRVQIAASKSQMNDAQLKKIYSGPKEIHRFKEDGYYKYTIEETPSYPDAQRVLKESGVNRAFISAYKGDTKWNLKEAIIFQDAELIQPRAMPVTEDEPRADIANENNDFRYRVQIAASKGKIREAQLKKEYSGPEEIRFFEEEGYYKYYIEETPNYYVARKTLRECKVDSAFISVYKSNIKWPLQDAIALQYKIPPVQSELAETDSIVTIVTVNFELDEFVLLPNERSHLREYVVDALKNNSNYHAIVNGYTDIRGSEAYNFGLSQERAHFVEQLIIEEGISSESVTTQYFGESQVIKYCPENENCDESVHQVNRRVEILLLVKKKSNPLDIRSLTNRHQ